MGFKIFDLFRTPATGAGTNTKPVTVTNAAPSAAPNGPDRTAATLMASLRSRAFAPPDIAAARPFDMGDAFVSGPAAASEIETARPATHADLRLVVKALETAGVDYMLLGGQALAAHGYNRGTTDIDMIIPEGVAVGEKVQKALMSLPDQVARDIDPEWFTEGDTIRVADQFVVDLMFRANGHSFEELKQHRVKVDFNGLEVSTLSLEGLLKTKPTVREKDIADRRVLERALLAMKTE